METTSVTTNVTSITNEKLQELNNERKLTLIPVFIYFVLLIIIGIFGNSVVCYVFGFRLRMSTQHFLVVVLAAIDFATCLFLPLDIYDLR